MEIKKKQQDIKASWGRHIKEAIAKTLIISKCL